MEKFQEQREIAKKKIKIADHILTQTYPLVKDPKLLLGILDNIFLAMVNSIGAILEYERAFKRIPPFKDNFDSKYNMFQSKIVGRYEIDKMYLTKVREVKELILKHRKSPIEFKRDDKFVICDEDYKMKTISITNIKEYINDAKSLSRLAEKITTKNEEIFKQ